MAKISPGQPVADDVVAGGDWNSQVCAAFLGLKADKSNDGH
jgi:hydroxyethylthiazole kinase-like sugar kinase family protein